MQSRGEKPALPRSHETQFNLSFGVQINIIFYYTKLLVYKHMFYIANQKVVKKYTHF